MLEYAWRANAHILLWLNHWLAARPELYKLAALLTNKGTDVAVVVTLLWLWFWPEKDKPLVSEVKVVPRRDDMPDDEDVAPASRGGLAVLTRPKATAAKAVAAKAAVAKIAVPKITGGKRVLRGTPAELKRYTVRSLPRLTLTESRAQLLVVGAALMSAYIAARLIGVEVNVSRPFATYLPLREGELSLGSFQALARRSDGSFPSNHAVLLAALPTAMFYWNRTVGWLWAAFSALLTVIRIATGFHYPFDMLVGSLLGMGAVWGAMSVYQREGRLHQWANGLARGFYLSNWPYCYILYFFVAVIGAEVFINHLNAVMQIIFSLRGMIIYRFTQGA